MDRCPGRQEGSKCPLSCMTFKGRPGSARGGRPSPLFQPSPKPRPLHGTSTLCSASTEQTGPLCRKTQPESRCQAAVGRLGSCSSSKGSAQLGSTTSLSTPPRHCLPAAQALKRLPVRSDRSAAVISSAAGLTAGRTVGPPTCEPTCALVIRSTTSLSRRLCLCWVSARRPASGPRRLAVSISLLFSFPRLTAAEHLHVTHDCPARPAKRLLCSDSSVYAAAETGRGPCA